jgi:hypothetical protein
VPDQQEFWGTPDDNSVKVNLIASQVVCELRRAVQKVFWKNQNVPVAYIGGPNAGEKPRDLKWFESWSVQVTLTLTIAENTAINPGVSLINVLPNGLTKFSNGSVTTPQSFTLGLGGTLSSAATRTDKLNMFYKVGELETALPSRDLTCIPPEQATGDLFIQSDLKLYDWLSAAILPYDARVITYQNNNTAQNAISHEVKFEIISNGNVSPQWKLVRVSANTGSTPLFGVGRDRTQDLLITFGPTQKGPNGTNELATAAQNLHSASQIGVAVGQNLSQP